MDEKVWYASKTIWINLLAIVALVVQSQTGFIIDGELQGALLIVINAVLRLISKDKVMLKTDGSTKFIAYLFIPVLILPIIIHPGCATLNIKPGAELTAEQEAALTQEQALYYALNWYNGAWDKYHKVWLALPTKEQKQEWIRKYHVRFQDAGKFLDSWALTPDSAAQRLRWRSVKNQLENVLIELAISK